MSFQFIHDKKKEAMPPMNPDEFRDDMPNPKRSKVKPIPMVREQRVEDIVTRHEKDNKPVIVQVTWALVWGILWRMVAIILPIAGIIQWILIMIAMGREQ
jgi:hypothetical protein